MSVTQIFVNDGFVEKKIQSMDERFWSFRETIVCFINKWSFEITSFFLNERIVQIILKKMTILLNEQFFWTIVQRENKKNGCKMNNKILRTNEIIVV